MGFVWDLFILQYGICVYVTDKNWKRQGDKKNVSPNRTLILTTTYYRILVSTKKAPTLEHIRWSFLLLGNTQFPCPDSVFTEQLSPFWIPEYVLLVLPNMPVPRN